MWRVFFRVWIGVLLLSVSNVTFAQKYVISGTVKDGVNGVPGAGITVKELKKTTISKLDGTYSLSVSKEGTYTLVFKSIGFKKLEKKVTIQSEKTDLDVSLESDSYALGEVIVSETAKKNVRSTEMGVSRLSMKTIEKVPAFMGEVDLVRTIQMMPGVTTVGEGASGFNVRGGSIDHNLLLLDEAPVYNSSHVLGFFSIYNPDAIKDATLIKGGIGANYGGRLASVLDVKMKEGNSDRYETTGGIGTLFSRLSFGGPVSENGTFIVAARRSYLDMFLKMSSDPAINSADVNFTDLSFKYNQKLNDKNKITTSFYWGRDLLGFKFGNTTLSTDWGSTAASFIWNHSFHSNFYSNLALTFGRYQYQFGVANTTANFDWKSNLNNYGVKYDFNYTTAKNTWMFGATSGYYRFNPGNSSFSTANSYTGFSIATQHALESGLYIEDEYTFNSDFSIRGGLRLSAYQLFGPISLYEYAPSIEGQRKAATASTTYNSGAVVAKYFYPEPRLSARYSINDNASIKAGYNRMVQYVHLISAGMAAAPFDNYVPTTKNIKPEIADQVSVGYFQNLMDDILETSVEVYYKEMQNQIDYVSGARTFLNKQLEGELLFGRGRSYGAEFFIKKSKGRATGWISYTLAKTERLVDGINNYDWFPAKYDRRHNFNITLMYDITKKWSFSADWVFLSGTRASMPTSRYTVLGMVVENDYFETRNQYQMPNYHRLDFSLTYEFEKKIRGRYTSNIVFSVYNVYARKNPYMIYTQPNEQNSNQTEAVQLSIIGSAIPAVSYNFKF